MGKGEERRDDRCEVEERGGGGGGTGREGIKSGMEESLYMSW